MTLRRLAIPLLLALAVLPFVSAVRGRFVWDDTVLLANNVNLRSPDGWRVALQSQFFEASGNLAHERQQNRQIYRPVVSLAYWVEHRAWGVDTVGYHTVNLALHAACVLLLFFWLRRRGFSELGAFIGAALFATHPSRSESVAWISGCTDLWMALWVLIGLTIWDRTRGIGGAMASGAAFTLAFLCKEVAIVVPLAILVDEALRGTLRERLLRVISVGAVAAVAVVVRVLHIGVRGNGGDLGTPLAIATRVIATLGGYVRIVLFPWPASTQVGYLLSANTGGPQEFPPLSIVVGMVTVVLLGVLLIASLNRPALRPWLADAAWFVIPALPVLNLIPLTMVTYVNERHTYLASIGLAALAARAFGRMPPRVAAPIAAVLVLAYAGGAAAHARHFVSNEALWTYEAEQHPQDFVALSNLLQVRLEQGRSADAQAVALQMMNVMPHGEDKAASFRYWLDAELEQALRANEAEVARVRRQFDRIAAKETPEGECGRIYASIDEAGQKWLRRSPAFRLRRASAAAALGDFGSAARQLEALERDASQSGALRPWVAALVAQGLWTEAQQTVSAHPTDPEAPRLQQVLLGASSLASAASTEAERSAVVENVLGALGQGQMVKAVQRNVKN